MRLAKPIPLIRGLLGELLPVPLGIGSGSPLWSPSNRANVSQSRASGAPEKCAAPANEKGERNRSDASHKRYASRNRESDLANPNWTNLPRRRKPMRADDRDPRSCEKGHHGHGGRNGKGEAALGGQDRSRRRKKNQWKANNSGQYLPRRPDPFRPL